MAGLRREFPGQILAMSFKSLSTRGTGIKNYGFNRNCQSRLIFNSSRPNRTRI